MFRLFTVFFVLLGQWYLLSRIIRYISDSPKLPHWVKNVMVAIFAFTNIPFIVMYIYIGSQTTFPEEFLTLLLPFFIWHMATLFIFVVLAMVTLIRFPFQIIFRALTLHPAIHNKVTAMKESPKYQQYDASRRTFLRTGVIGLSAYSFIGTTVGVAGEAEFETIGKTIVIPGLPEEFKGFTIGMMSDIHSSVFMNKDDMSNYVRAMNKLKTDLIVVTGDFVNSKTEEVYPFAEAFSELRSPNGVYGCLGNHDFFARDVERVAKEVDGCGVRLLRNDAVRITKNNSVINLVGVDDIGRGVDPDDYLTKAMSFVKNDAPNILLCHKPYYFDNARRKNVALTLSGHTHGGQIVFGTIDNVPISLATLASQYVAGLYTLGESQLYVNKGIGSVGVPFRINCPPELTVITLA